MQGSAQANVDDAMIFVLRIYQQNGGGFPNFPNNYDCEPGTTIAIHAGAAYRGGSMGGRLVDLTDQVNWTSSDTNTATVGQGATEGGVVQCLKSGVIKLTAAYQGQTDTVTVTVANSTLVKIDLLPGSASMNIGDTQQFHAQATYSDNKQADITANCTWLSADGSVATVSNAGSSRGLVTGAGSGMTTVTASYLGVTGTANINVAAAHLKLVIVTPTNPSVARRTRNYHFTATALYDDNSQTDITTLVMWGSSNASVATISNSAGNQGYIRINATGSTDISATYQGMVGTTTLTVF